MSKYEKLRESLPSLYRPEENDESLMAQYFKAVAGGLDDMGIALQQIMQAHWFDMADKAELDSFLSIQRRRQGMDPLDRQTPEDRSIILNFPYIEDLARLAGLLALPPWSQPTDLRESVEVYRLRIQRIVALYKNGLGTPQAIRAMTEAMLAPDMNVPLARRDRSFSLEYLAALELRHQDFKTRGGPEDTVGPLMRWHFDNDGLYESVPTLYVQGIAAEGTVKDATEQPLIERFQTLDGAPPVGIAYNAVIPPGEVLRLSAASRLWLLGDTVSSAHKSQAEGETEAMADRDWSAIAGLPAGTPQCMHFAYDGYLWLAVDNGGDTELWRYDGTAWQRFFVADALDVIHSILDDGRFLLLATANGLQRFDLYPVVADDYSLETVAGVNAEAIYAIENINNQYWCATATALRVFNDDWTVAQVHLDGAEWRCVHIDDHGVVYAGGALGLYQYDQGRDTWYAYVGAEAADQYADWRTVESALVDDVYLPTVNTIATSTDQSIWVGTDEGLARWLASPVRGVTYTTRLEAFPDVIAEPVYQLQRDPRGMLWICSDRGVFRFDGRDLRQYQSANQHWLSLGRADQYYADDTAQAERGAWRFNRTLPAPTWQRFDEIAGEWTQAVWNRVGTAEDAVRQVLWSTPVEGELGTWDTGTKTWTPNGAGLVDANLLSMRIKPTDDRPVDGGMPYVPTLPSGRSVWRYLALETAPETSTERPRWTREGRLIMPPDQTAAYPGRFGDYTLPPANESIDQHVFAYNPAAQVWLQWHRRGSFSTLVRLALRENEDAIHPAIVDRVWSGIQRARPAGVKVALAVEDQLLKTGD